jgi:hypothetical protein
LNLTLSKSKPVDFEEPFFIRPGYSSSHTFTESGLYEYHDRNRPWMYGYVYVLPSEAADAHLDLEISGLKDVYRLGEPIEFAVDASGYETGCYTFKVRIDKIDASGEPYSFSGGEYADCDVNPPFSEASYRFPQDTPSFYILINQTGTYRVTVSFWGTIVSVNATQEFTIS